VNGANNAGAILQAAMSAAAYFQQGTANSNFPALP
jgi:hypothetical protein